ncbi:NADH-dependent phenylglyoxylate dehydrogenase subunit alpha [Sedimenticola hydrogenitrophicus]|uniref:NADH-dependent phenylglyoxylate dehydrogenase subunit alpha n=1 Tax=Sedimenticola hydrogenitrophicus TaxID=2967975 RepID=UPI0021A40072|nr:phenylglyoxylate dehydrogenase [Sedimenticola hydrogenitrophicus]
MATPALKLKHPGCAQSIVCDGNEAAAWAVALARPDVVAVYPITPQSSLVEYVSQFIADGKIEAELMNVEGEHSVLSALHGAALAGGRTYTATCGPGLAFMFEPYWRTPGMRLPIVASLVTRDGITPQCVWGGQQDAMTMKETGWIQIYCETVQEVLDTTVMAYRIAEHHDVMLPVNICHDGNYLSYGVTQVEVPEQSAVDDYLGEKNINWHVALDPLRPMAVDPLTGGAGGPGPAKFVAYRKGLCQGMQNALGVIEQAHADWADIFGRDYAPLVEEYRLDDADYALVTIGSMTGAAKDAVDSARERGRKVGLIKIKTFRPFPVAAMTRALRKVRAVGVVDRSVHYGWDCGPLYQEVLSCLYRAGQPIAAGSFIGGLAGADLTEGHFARAIERTAQLLAGDEFDSPVWLNEHD